MGDGELWWFPLLFIGILIVIFGGAGILAYTEASHIEVETAKCEALQNECEELWCMAKFHKGDTGTYYLKMYEMRGCAE